MNRTEKLELTNKIIDEISRSNLGLYDIIEVLANIFIMQGATYMGLNNEHISNKIELANLVVEDIERNGEALPNALVRQGLVMLSWLKSKEKIYEKLIESFSHCVKV